MCYTLYVMNYTSPQLQMLSKIKSEVVQVFNEYIEYRPMSIKIFTTKYSLYILVILTNFLKHLTLNVDKKIKFLNSYNKI